MTDTERPRVEETEAVAREEARRVGDSARREAGRVVDEARHQGRELYEEARARARDEARNQTDRAAEGLRAVSADMRKLSADEQTETSLGSWMEQGADRLDDFAARVSERGFDGVMEDVKGFARRNPGTFLGISFGVGLLAGRLARNMEMDSGDTAGPMVTTAQERGVIERSRRPDRGPSVGQPGPGTTRPGVGQ